MRRCPFPHTFGKRTVRCLFAVGFAAMLSSLPCLRSSAAERDPFQGDARLQRVVTVRVSRMAISDLLQRLDREMGVRLAAEGQDVADQKVDLFTHGKPVSAAEILTAIADLLNTDAPPRSCHWERAGQPPAIRYTLVRDVASRQWQKQQTTAAELRMAHVLKERFAALGREPFRPEKAGRLELPSMRKLLPLLTEEQFVRLCADRDLSLKPEACTPAQRALLGPLVQELVADQVRRSPKETEEALARAGPLERFEGSTGVLVRGEAPRYTIEVSANGPYPLGQLGYLGEAVDATAFAVGRAGRGAGGPPVAPSGPDPVFALPPRTSWLMGDVVAEIAARAHVNLIADDYTQSWPRLAGHTGARPLSAWLTLIREEYRFESSRAGSFAKLRNPVWWLDEPREVPVRLLTRWRELIQGTNADRMRMLIEIAERAPYSPHPRLIWDRLQLLENSPEMSWNVSQEGPRSLLNLIDVVANRQVELLFYSHLPPAKQQALYGPGLRVSWSEFPAELRQYFVRRFWPVEKTEQARAISLFMRYSSDRLQLNWEYPMGRGGHQAELLIRPQPADDVRQLLGKLLPQVEIAEPSGKTSALRPQGPVLLYVTPMWPRPVVVRHEEHSDLKALERLTGPRTYLLGTEATAEELRDGWRERGLSLVPLALTPASAQRLGARHLPLAILVDAPGRVAWVKEGYDPKDEDEWRRQWARNGP